MSMRHFRRGGLLVLAAAVVGCASSTPHPEPSAVVLGRDLPAYSADREPDAELDEPAGTLTLRAALAAALTRSPALAAYAWEIRAREVETIQAGRPPNPELAAEFENVAGTGPHAGTRSAETTLSVFQTLELGGARGKRRAVAEGARDAARWEYEIARADVLTEVRHAFTEILAAQHRLDLADELASVAKEALAAVSRRVESGGVSPVEARRARIEVATSRIDRERAARALEIARHGLAATWGSATPRFTRADGELDVTGDLPALEDLLALAAESPEVMQWASAIERRRAELALTRAERVPELRIGAGVRHLAETGDDALLFAVELPLPLFDRGGARKRAAEHRVTKAAHERRAAEVRVRADITMHVEHLLAADSESAVLRDRILPEAESAFAMAEDAYRRGLMRFTDVLDVRRTLFELRGRRVDALARRQGALADLERLVGRSLDDIHRPRETER